MPVSTLPQQSPQKRKSRGFTQEELAEKVGIGQQSLSRMEQGHIAPKFERLQDFAEALNCPVADLFRTGDKNAEIQAVSIMDILQPLSTEAQELVVNHVADMVRIMKGKK